MAEKAIERALHYKCPEWASSVRSARDEVGFSFDLRGHRLWDWLVSGGHMRATEIAEREVIKLGAEDLFEYYLCCFYSDYERPGGTIDFEAIRGTPWVTLKCPAAGYGEEWRQSIQKAREDIDRKLGHKDGLAKGKTYRDFLSWYFEGGGADEIAELAVIEVERLGMGDVNSLLWFCCLSPTGVYRLVDRSGLFYNRFPQLMDWDRFALKCPNRAVRSRSRAYPGGIDWGGGVIRPDSFPIQRLGIHCQTNSDAHSKLTLTVSWNPLIVTGATEVVAAVRDLQRYYEIVCKPRLIGNMPGILEKLIKQTRKGGRPQWGVLQDKIALEFDRLINEEGLSEKEVIKQSVFSLQEDSYGNLTHSATVRRYIRRGKQLRLQGNKYQS
ncbi:hypothetical protein ACFLYF_00180 [Chloroflexota bacterium]